MVLWKVNEEDCGGMSAGRFKEVIASRPITLTVGWPQTDEPQMAADAGALGDQTPIQAAKAKHKHQWPLMSPEERKGAVIITHVQTCVHGTTHVNWVSNSCRK